MDNFLTSDNLEKLLFLVAGLLIRELYGFLKKKLSKGPKPKIHIEYKVFNSGSRGMKPRIFRIDSTMKIENISTLYAYDLNLTFNSERWKTVRSNKQIVNGPIKLKSLEPKKIWVISSIEEIENMDYPEVKPTEDELIADYFKDVRVTLTFKNEKDKKFKVKYPTKN